MVSFWRRTAEIEAVEGRETALGNLPEGFDAASLTAYVMTVASGIAVQARSGLSGAELDRVVDIAMRIWPA